MAAVVLVVGACSETRTPLPAGRTIGFDAMTRGDGSTVRLDAGNSDAIAMGADALATSDATLDDAGAMDTSTVDAGSLDASGPLDATPTDATATDAAGMDATTADAGPTSCAFGGTLTNVLDPRQPIDAARLDDLATCVAQNPGSASALVDGLLREYEEAGSGAAPWRNGMAMVLYRGDASGLTVSGSFDNWPTPGQRSFRNITGTDLHVAEVPVGRGDRHQYKLTRDTGGGIDWFTNPNARWVTWDGIDRSGVGQFNNELVGPDHVVGTSLIHHRVLVRRDVYLQLPVAYFANSATALGVLYVNDGNETLTRAGMQAVVDQTIAANRASPLAVVYVGLEDQNFRIAEYTYGTGTTGDVYIDELADQIVPAVEQFIATRAMPDNRGLSGASLGGLISFHGVWRRQDVFRLIGAQSPSLWFDGNEMVTRFNTGNVISARIYLDSGNPNDNYEVTNAMAQVLNVRGYDHLHVVEPNAQHDWAYWAGRFDELLEFLY